ncbi:MAG: hypothetical protein ABEJ86_01300 [Halococcoides sp.]
MTDTDETHGGTASTGATDDATTGTTDQPTSGAGNQPTTGGSDRSADASGGSGSDPGRQRVLRYLEYAALLGLAFLALIAVIGAYVSATTAIDLWVSGRFKSIFQTAFNLVVLGLVGIGISTIVRRRFDV